MSGQWGGESPSGTTIRDYTDLPIIDQFGNAWGLSRSGQVMVDGQIDRSTNGVTELAYINRLIWQWVATKRLWWSKSSPLAPWLPPGGTTNAPFGPTPDPRLDQILTAVASLANADAAAFGGMAARIDALQSAVDNIPPPSPPDPRIDDLIRVVRRGLAMQATAIDGLTNGLGAQNARIAEWGAQVLARFDALDATTEANALALADIASQINRVVVMLLDLFPAHPKTKIVIDTSRVTLTSQPAPAAPGP